MSIVKLKKVQEPIMHNGKERLAGGWSTAAVGAWLISKKPKAAFVGLGEIAAFAYGRESPANRQSVKNNIASLRRWLADKDEFLLPERGYRRRTQGLKVCNFANDEDRALAQEALAVLVERGEVSFAEATRWQKHLGYSATSENRLTEGSPT